ncbi:DUF1360 domain-containing protein [Streptomyces sp. NPDC088768]|uniref:DUF1360 domain-containing protein n=1 Tax=Streptomyces sp. NPDC088768 TaxID=3365894 RepID=UPI0038000AF2
MIALTTLALLALAGYRATRLIVADSILDPLRDQLFAWHEARLDSKARDFVITLLSCTYCIGWWLSGAILATYLFASGQWHDAPVLVHGVEWLAVAGGQALLSRIDDTLPTRDA